MAELTEAPTTADMTKELTGDQSKGGVAAAVFGLESFREPDSGTYDTYRLMRNNPTIALARAAAMAPIRIAEWSLEARSGTPQARIDFIQEQFTVLWPVLIKEMLYSLDYGWKGFEKIYNLVDGQLVYHKLKPLNVSLTEIAVVEKTGQFAGLTQQDVYLPPARSFVCTYDGEDGDLYGRTRNENSRGAWSIWEQLVEKTGQYATKVAGVVPMMEYPEGKSKDETGAEVENYLMAVSLLNNLSQGKGICMPDKLAPYAMDLAKAGIDLTKLKAWKISFLESGTAYGSDFDVLLRRFESLMLRGWLVPERSAVEGQFGTKAEAETHADLALTIADLTLLDIIRQVNWYLINPLLVFNFGPEAENSVWMERAGLDPLLKAFFRTIIEKILTAPNNIDMLLNTVNLDAVLDAVGLPKQEQTISNEDLLTRREEMEEAGLTPGLEEEPEEENRGRLSQFGRSIFGALTPWRRR